MEPLSCRAAGVDIEAGEEAVGYVVVVPDAAADAATALLQQAGEAVFALGEIVSGPRGVELA